ncbi:MAG: SIMPL domain-containing protein [Rhodobacteraceae bacterium]|nr:SIMPL domain-containing protein [Paracoccaceae bacterium]
MRILPAVAVLVALALPAAAADPAPATLSVTGEGRVEARPDMALVTMGVTTEADTAREALDANNARIAATIARLKSAGIEDRDIQTSGLSLGPRYDYNRSASDGTAQITGFIATNSVTVRIRALGLLGETLDAVVTDGANTLGGISFGMQDPAPLLDEARKESVADARRKAELYAAAAGVRLGRILSIADQSGAYYPPVPMPMGGMAMEAKSAVPVASGEVTLSSNVAIVWELVQD